MSKFKGDNSFQSPNALNSVLNKFFIVHATYWYRNSFSGIGTDISGIKWKCYSSIGHLHENVFLFFYFVTR